MTSEGLCHIVGPVTSLTKCVLDSGSGGSGACGLRYSGSKNLSGGWHQLLCVQRDGPRQWRV